MPATLIIPILVAGLLPYLFTGISKAGAFSAKDNAHTRHWQSELSGWRKRAYWAHQNSFEMFPLFAAAALVAALQIPESGTAHAIAWAFIGLRIAYGACYMANLPRLRSLVWFGSFGCPIALFILAIQG